MADLLVNGFVLIYVIYKKELHKSSPLTSLRFCKIIANWESSVGATVLEKGVIINLRDGMVS